LVLVFVEVAVDVFVLVDTLVLLLVFVLVDVLVLVDVFVVVILVLVVSWANENVLTKANRKTKDIFFIPSFPFYQHHFISSAP